MLRNQFPPSLVLTLIARKISRSTRAPRAPLDQHAHPQRSTFTIVGSLTITIIPQELALECTDRAVDLFQLAREGICTRRTVL